MRKSLLMLFIGSLLIISGCSAKEDLEEQKSKISNQKVEEENLISTDLTEKELKPGNTQEREIETKDKGCPYKDRCQPCLYISHSMNRRFSLEIAFQHFRV